MDDRGLGLGVLHLDLQEVTPAEQAKLFCLGHIKFIWHHEETMDSKSTPDTKVPLIGTTSTSSLLTRHSLVFCSSQGRQSACLGTWWPRELADRQQLSHLHAAPAQSMVSTPRRVRPQRWSTMPVELLLPAKLSKVSHLETLPIEWRVMQEVHL